MRFLGIGETCDLGDMYLRLRKAGHEVRVHMSDPDSHGVMEGMLDFSPDWRVELDWIRGAVDGGFVLFETASSGDIQDELREDGFSVIGGSAQGDRLENDRLHGQQVIAEMGLRTAPSHLIEGFDASIEFIRSHPRRYVFKLNGSDWSSTRTYVGQMSNGADVIAMIKGLARGWTFDDEPSCLLMDHVTGVEVGVGAFFNGNHFIGPPNLDWEHKRFFPGDVGELTGEMGTVVTYRGAERIFNATLGRLAPVLAESRYTGYVNLNTIVNEDGIWPLEFTSRFGYPGFSILGSLHDDGWDTIFAALASGDRSEIRTKDGLSVGVVITVPPFPYPDGYEHLGKGTPICFHESMTEADRNGIHYGEVALADGELVTAGMIGYVMVVTGTGGTIESARSSVYNRVAKVVIPNMRYRNDIGAHYKEACSTLRRLGWLD